MGDTGRYRCHRPPEEAEREAPCPAAPSWGCAQASPWLPTLHWDGGTSPEGAKTPALGCQNPRHASPCTLHPNTGADPQMGTFPHGDPLGWLPPGISRATKPRSSPCSAGRKCQCER